MKCQYDPEALDLFCAGALKAVRTCFIDDLKEGLSPDPAQYAAEFLFNISYFAPMFKPQVWADEKEWRLLFIKPAAEHKKLLDGRIYIEVPQTEPLPIIALCAGANCEEQSVRPLRIYMHENHLDIPIHVADRNTSLRRAG